MYNAPMSRNRRSNEAAGGEKWKGPVRTFVCVYVCGEMRKVSVLRASKAVKRNEANCPWFLESRSTDGRQTEQ